jgi:predicted CXXCH cytochrome family protein
MLALVLVTLITAAPLSPAASRGREVVRRAQCTRCHDVTDTSGKRGVAAAPRAEHCVSCHNWILDTKDDPAAQETARATFPLWDRYLDNIVHFTSLPDLGTLTRRVDPKFVRRYLDAPFDLRPHLDEAMLAPRLSAKQKNEVVAYLTELNAGRVTHAGAGSAPTPERLAAGEAAFATGSCTTCHVFGSSGPAGLAAQMRGVAQHAPNLRFVRERMGREQLVRFILDPQAVDPKARMPRQAVDRARAELLADYLLFADLGEETPRFLARPRIATLTRRVPYEEVRSAVLDRICIHCHMDPDKNAGRGGPGHDGGLTYAGVRLDLETWEGITRGMEKNGERLSILEPAQPGALPRLLEALLRRYDETAADPYNPPRLKTRGTAPGMPMAMPPLTREQLEIVATWLEQGAPGPATAQNP